MKISIRVWAIIILQAWQSFGAVEPSITQQPQSEDIVAGTNAVFTVGATGQTPLTYRWSFNGTNLTDGPRISGATNLSLTISNVALTDQGNYQVVVSNRHGVATSSNANLTVGNPPSILIQPTNRIVMEGSNCAFTAKAAFSGSAVIRWEKDGTVVVYGGRITESAVFSPNAFIISTLSISNVQPNDAGTYRLVVVSNAYGSTASSPASLTALPVSTVKYVNLNSTNPIPPYTAWNFAATNIQDAIDVANNGDTVQVTNGIYETGGQLFSDGPYEWTDRVAVTKPLIVQSVNGPSVTIIKGYQVPVTTNGPFAVRCAYLTSGAILSGFTLTNGATRDEISSPSINGGGIWCASSDAIVTNCVLVGNAASKSGGGVYGGTLVNCILVNNTVIGEPGPDPGIAPHGGAATGSILNNCIISNNSAYNGGGTYNCVSSNCTLIGNKASGDGGGAFYGTLNSCVVSNNSCFGGGGGTFNCVVKDCNLEGNTGDVFGGGANFGFLTNCSLTGNHSAYGGGAEAATLADCMLIGNTASEAGGGAGNSDLLNCDLISNSAFAGGATFDSTLVNCMVISNSASTYGGGANGSVLIDCVVSNNTAMSGGGIYNAFLNNCVLTANVADDVGGGALYSVLNKCMLLNNLAEAGGGGGAQACTLNDCSLLGNSALVAGGGAADSTLNNCLVTGNFSANGGGGAWTSTLNNCTVTGNSASVDSAGTGACV
ncbi:MAG: hypothetical protein QOD03_1013, partial [Verrucomicrobiota bacterium]